MRATRDLLYGQVEMPDAGQRASAPGIWAEEEVDIAARRAIYGPVYLGDGVKIREGAIIPAQA